jgi:hypothetical protein
MPLARKVRALEDPGLDAVRFKAVLVIHAITERLVVGTSAPTACLRYLSIDN